MNVSDVPRRLQSWVSIIQTVVVTADVFQLFYRCSSCTTCLPRTVTNFVIGMIHLPKRSSHNYVVGNNQYFVRLTDGYYCCTGIHVLIKSRYPRPTALHWNTSVSVPVNRSTCCCYIPWNQLAELVPLISSSIIEESTKTHTSVWAKYQDVMFPYRGGELLQISLFSLPPSRPWRLFLCAPMTHITRPSSHDSSCSHYDTTLFSSAQSASFPRQHPTAYLSTTSGVRGWSDILLIRRFLDKFLCSFLHWAVFLR